MTKTEATQHAKEVVNCMLNGRCQPETEDVENIASDANDQDLIIQEIHKVLQQLQDSLQ